MKNKITVLLAVILMIFAQVPFTAFAASTDIRAELLSPDTLPDGRVELRYDEDFCYDYSKFNNGFNQYSWSIVEGALPPGLELYPDGPTWEPWIYGTPTKAGTYIFTIEGAVTHYINGENVRRIAACKTYTLTILPAYPLKISNNTLYHGYENQSYSITLDEDRYRTVAWSMQNAEGGGLPEGLSIHAESGKITWETPKAGKYQLKITATRNEESVSKVLRLIIEPGDGCKHEETKKTTRKAATCKENGLADYWYCDVCESYFLDAECNRYASADGLEKLYTVGFHSDKAPVDGKCDTCGKAMPSFKKVTEEKEITSGGMYLVVSKIGDQYYTLKVPEKEYGESIEATEITQNPDGTFSYPETDTEVMVLKTEFAAMCKELDAGKPRYSLGTTIGGIPYSVSSDDYGGSVQMYAYENNKYGFRMSLTEERAPAIAGVYSEYWGGSSGKSEAGILNAFVGTKDDTTKKFFSFRTKESYEETGIYMGSGTSYKYDTLETYPIELYKLTYGGTVGDNSYTISDAQSMVTINQEFTVLDQVESNTLSTASGIGEAVKMSYVERVIANQTDLSGDISVQTYADITLKGGEGTVDEWSNTNISSLLYEVTPKLALRGEASETTYTQTIADENFDGSEITLTLCVGNMYPAQIIHYKEDGTKEYFYSEHAAKLQPGQKTFSTDEWGTGNFVTFTIDSFSDIEIRATVKAEPITVGNATVTAPVGGRTPSFTAVSDDPSRYSVEILRWIDVENNKDIEQTDLTNVKSPYYRYKFVPGKQYEAVVRFTAVGDYTLSYSNQFTINGKETNWTGDGLKRTYRFTAEVPSTETAVSGKTFTVTGKNIDDYVVVLALYQEDEQGVGRLAECQTAVYHGEPITFTTTVTDYTSAKVMVWETIESLKSVTGAEIVKLGQSV